MACPSLLVCDGIKHSVCDRDYGLSARHVIAGEWKNGGVFFYDYFAGECAVLFSS